jgi:hypothetical protein
MPPRPVKLKYHQATFLLLDEKPIISERAVKEIDRWEKRTGLKLPAAVKEWYSLEEAEQRFRHKVSKFEPKPLGAMLKQWKRSRIEMLEIGWLKKECNYYTTVERSANPQAMSFYLDMEAKEGTFSAFVFRLIWDGLNHADPLTDHHEGDLVAGRDVCGPMEFDFLQEHFFLGLHEVFEVFRVTNPFQRRRWGKAYVRKEDGKPSSKETSFPDRHDHYFFLPGKRILVRCTGDPTTGEMPALWTIGADTPEQLRDVTQRIWLCGHLSRTLKARDKSGKALLRELRRMMGQK